MMFEFGLCKSLRSFCYKTGQCSCFPNLGGRTCKGVNYVDKSYRVSFVKAFARILLYVMPIGQPGDTFKSVKAEWSMK